MEDVLGLILGQPFGWEDVLGLILGQPFGWEFTVIVVNDLFFFFEEL
jgi:hypothetical protein